MNDDIQIFGQASPRAHYIPALGYGGLVFTSGQLPLLDDGSHGGDLRSTIRRAKCSPTSIACSPLPAPADRVLHVTAFLDGIDHWDAFNRIFPESFGDWRPTRTVVPVPNLHSGYLLEIEAVAAAALRDRT